MARKRARQSGGPRASQLEAIEIQELNRRLAQDGPGGQAETSYLSVRGFEDLPLSQHTRTGLKEHKFIRLTAVQRAALPYTLSGKDVLGAAKTGSGKTLAFVLPVGFACFDCRFCFLISIFEQQHFLATKNAHHFASGPVF